MCSYNLNSCTLECNSGYRSAFTTVGAGRVTPLMTDTQHGGVGGKAQRTHHTPLPNIALGSNYVYSKGFSLTSGQTYAAISTLVGLHPEV